MTATGWPVGFTKRSHGKALDEGPLRHAKTSVRASATGKNHLAVCGASVLPWPMVRKDDLAQLERFDPDHPRACPKCVHAVR